MGAQTRYQGQGLLFRRLVLIYQMPKIGSQTIEATLRQWSFPHPIYRFHYLSPASTRTLRSGLSSSIPDPAWKREAQQQLDSIRTMSRVVRLRRFLCLCGCRIPKLEVITGVRELISLMVASIFENYLYFVPNLESMTVNACRAALLHPKTFKTLNDWFDLELKSFLGIDVFKTRFPYKERYAIYENRFARVLVYRYDALPWLSVLLSECLAHAIPELVNCNLGESKPYAQQYRFVKENLRLPADAVAGLHDCKIMRHFYSDEERHSWWARWTAPRADAGRSRALAGVATPA
jgi:hypothetical protein